MSPELAIPFAIGGVVGSIIWRERQWIKALVTRRASTNRPEEAVGPEDWFDRQYRREIRSKHVCAGFLFVAAGGWAMPIQPLILTELYWVAGFFAACSGYAIVEAIQLVRALIAWQGNYRECARNTQEECIDLRCELAQLREKYSDLHFNYCVLSTVIEQTAEDKTEGAQIIHIRGERRDH